MTVKKIYRNGELIYDAEVEQKEILEQTSEPVEQEVKKRGRKSKVEVEKDGEEGEE